ncbi:MAG: formate/nitrite transporter family protein [Sphingobacteriaceae bacterium]|nr:formate/nitrite transporter family protein [Sphingobacteriaceae bacterium]
MEKETLKHVLELALKKQKVYDYSKLRFLLRSMLASMFIGFGVIVAFKTGNYFYLTHSPFAYPMAAFTFGAAIILIAYGGGDLFTGNTFYFTYAALQKQLKWPKVIRMWLLSYLGNILGACLFALLILGTGLYKESIVNSFLLNLVSHKMQLPTDELFYRAILCNWLVCMAFFIPMALKGDGPKLFTMVLFVFCFFISGYEHSVANMCTFAIALVLDHPGTISMEGVMHNLIPVTAGNILGGTIMMGAFYHYLNNFDSNDSL